MTPARQGHDAWNSYLADFHQEHSGITEDVLAAATADGRNPYEWLLEAVAHDARLLDLACGSAPLVRAGWRGSWVGVDRSPGELARARDNGAASVVDAEADHLPFDDHAFTVVLCSMALMLLDPLDACLDEIARVLTPDGSLVLLLPGGGRRLRPFDLWQWGRLLLQLRRGRLRYPNDAAVGDLRQTLARHHLTVINDERRRFALSIRNEAEASRFVDSLYLPGIRPRFVVAAKRVAATWVGRQIGIPLRRVVIRF